MTLREFIRQNRKEIDRLILENGKVVNPRYLNNEERRQWILKDEFAHRWAQSCGVKFEQK